MDWYYKEGDTKIGPIADDRISELVQNGTITPRTMVWSEISAMWKPYAEISGIAPSKRSVQDGPSSEQPTEIGAKSGDALDPYADEEDTGRHTDTCNSAQMTEAYCSKCFNKFPVDMMVRYGDANICADCKPLFFQKLKEGAEMTGDLRYAGFWIRFVAKFIDGMIMGMVGMLITALAGFSLFGHDSTFLMNPVRLAIYILINILQIALGIAYVTFFVGKYGATPGKMALGLRIVNPDGSKVSYMKAFGRYFAEIVSGLILGIGYIMAAFDDEKRALHDRICNTRVIRKPA
ncbi:MAG TPA: RDD family protein [Dissulfurispiraceae bacterium]|nr:RDD family protein [Dissulfurispiraceae bacterium]